MRLDSSIITGFKTNSMLPKIFVKLSTTQRQICRVRLERKIANGRMESNEFTHQSSLENQSLQKGILRAKPMLKEMMNGCSPVLLLIVTLQKIIVYLTSFPRGTLIFFFFYKIRVNYYLIVAYLGSGFSYKTKKASQGLIFI